MVIKVQCQLYLLEWMVVGVPTYKPKWWTWNINVLLRMDNTAVCDNMKKITWQDHIFTVRSFILQMRTGEYFMKIEGEKYPSTSKWWQMTISEDDWNAYLTRKEIFIKKLIREIGDRCDRKRWIIHDKTNTYIRRIKRYKKRR